MQKSELMSTIENLENLKIKLAAMEAPFDTKIAKLSEKKEEKTRALKQAIKGLEELVKPEVVAHGASIKAPSGCLNLVYVKAKETWDSKKLEQQIGANPWLQDCKKVGNPSVQFRFKAQ